MKKRIFQIISILMLSVFSIGSFAQDNRTLDTKVADVLAQMPTKNTDHLNRAMDEIFALGQEGFQKLTSLLVPAGTGDDTAVRFALNSFSRYASQFGKCDTKAFAENNLLKALKNEKDVEVKTYIMNQLNLVAGSKTVEELTVYLTDENLVEPATQTILSIGCPKTSEVFLNALPNAEGIAQMTHVRALGQLKCKNAVSQITPLVKAECKSMQKTALTALANIGSPDSYKTMLKAASDVDFKYESTNATESFLEYTNSLGEKNELELMKKACKAIFKANTSEAQLHNYSTALKIYAKYLGYEATPLLLDVVDSPNKAFRYSVLNIAEKTGGIADTRKWIAKAETSTPEIQADIISMLGRRGCGLANEFITESLNASSESVRKEAIVALGKINGTEAVSTLVAHMAKGNDIDETKAVLTTLLDNQHLFQVTSQLDNTNGKAKAAVVDLIAAKAGTQYYSQVLALTSSADVDEKTAAFKALKRVSVYENTDQLIKLLLSVSDESEISETQKAIIAISFLFCFHSCS
ncbi:MAG: HEAT repeat domain-containing protein, partial [Draconibacterium sp.]|nr:HEAT repeat domain-containing protein [Draconibacterium sp.]